MFMEDYAQFTSISTIIRLTNVWIKFLIQIFIECIEVFTEDHTDRIEFTYRT